MPKPASKERWINPALTLVHHSLPATLAWNAPRMLLIVGTLTVLICVLGGYAAMGGHLAVLVQPFEVVIIVGAAIGAYVISNPIAVLKETSHGFKMALKGPRYGKDSYLELLGLLYSIFRLARNKGLLQLEQHGQP